MEKNIKHIVLIFAVFFVLGVKAQISPGGVNDGLYMWFDADWNMYEDSAATQKAISGSRVNYWGDRLTDTLKAITSQDSMRPTYYPSISALNGKGGVRFQRNNGVGDKFNNLHTNGFPVTKEITIYTVFLPLSAGAGDDAPFVGGYSESHWYGGSGIVDAEKMGITNDIGIALTNTSVAAGSGNSVTAQDVTLKIPSSLNTPQFAMVTRSGDVGSLNLWKNGGNHQSGTCGIGTLNGTQFTFGANNTLTSNPANYFDGYITNVMVFSRVLTDVEKVIIDNYLGAKYGIQNIDKDYYKMDNAANGDFDNEVAGIGQGFDGTNYTTAKGEGLITISNPSDLQNDEFLFWGTDEVNLTENELVDVPKGFTERLRKVWAVSEVGEVGSVTLKIELESNSSELYLLVDANQNGSFSDEPETSWIKSDSKTGTNSYEFSGINLADKSRFTFAKYQPLTNTFNKENSLVITPNGDFKNDEYPVISNGKVQVISKLGQLVKELNCPCSWDGTNSAGELVSTGVYMVKNENGSYVHVTVIR